MLKKSAALLTMFALTGCHTTTGTSATEATICREWRDSLPTASRKDTKQTQDEIALGYDIQAAVCPEFAK